MTQPADDWPDPSEGFQRRNFGDQRDDFDDEFGRIRTPAEIARGKLRVPAIMHIVAASVCIIGTMIGAVAIVIDAYDDNYGDEADLIIGVLLALLTLIGGGTLFGTVLAGGIYMLKLRRRRIVLVAAYIVTGLSLAGPYGILFYPFGIWALILLYSENIKSVFGTPSTLTTPPPPSEPKPALSKRMLLVMGEIGLPIMLFIVAMTAWDAYVYPRYWTNSEIFWTLGITLVIAGMFAAMIVYSLKTMKYQAISKPPEPLSTNDRDD